jgi:hypothetical protein
MKTVNYQTAFGVSRLLTVNLLLLASACTRDTLPVYEDADRVYFNRAGLADNIKEQIERNSDLTVVNLGYDNPQKGVKPYDILCFTDAMAPDPYNKTGKEYSVYILTDRYTTRILSADYSWKPSYDISNFAESNSYPDKEYIKKSKPIVCLTMKVGYISLSSG